MADLQRIIPRLVAADENTRLFTATHLILSIPASLDVIDSFAVMPGLGEHSRVLAAINAWQTYQDARYLLVSGSYEAEVAQPQLTLERLQVAPFNLQRTDNVLTQVGADHTRAQTDWLTTQIASHAITSLALFVSDWHMPRAYRSLLKSMLNAGVQIPLLPVTIGSSPSTIVPEYHETILRMSAGEAQRIKKYEANGQIASFDELTDYLAWLWKQEVVPIGPIY